MKNKELGRLILTTYFSAIILVIVTGVTVAAGAPGWIAAMLAIVATISGISMFVLILVDVWLN